MLNLPTMAEVAAARVGKPLTKPLPRVIAKPAKDKAKKDKDEAFRDRIWLLDKGRSRATGRKLSRGGMDWNLIGEVDHVINRSTAPDRVYDESNAILLSKAENRMKKTPCPRAPGYHLFEVEGPDDRRLPQTFTWRDADGKVIRQRVG